MRIGIRLAVSILVLTFIAISAAGVSYLWWRTAEQTSQKLASTINEQIVSAVSDEMQSITTEAKSAYTAVRTLLAEKVIGLKDSPRRRVLFIAQLQAQPTISAVAFGWPDGMFSTAHKLGDSAIEVIDIASGQSRQRIDTYSYVDGDLKLSKSASVDRAYAVKEQDWYRTAIEYEGPQFFNLTEHPGGDRIAVAFAGPIDVREKRQGVLAIVIELTRVSRFLSQLTTGKTADAFILDRTGGIVAAPDAEADEVTPLKANRPMQAIAVAALKGARDYDPEGTQSYRSQITKDGEDYDVVLTPLSLPGWSLATVVPESEFLGPVRKTIRELLFSLAFLIVVASIVSAWLAQRLVAAPLVKVVGEIKHVERFDLNLVKRHPSRLAELENLSGAIADMAGGLSAFRKYIPADLVRSLVEDGIEPRPGGAVRDMTVMFTDIAAFTGLSERLGNGIIPLLSQYLDLVSAQVRTNHGTIDKFIGDAVMAFWGAPATDADHAVNACRAALLSQRALRNARILDDRGEPLRMRVGINTGDMLVGNIGSEVRLNYTVLGDAVNIASRLEGANKQYGTDIVIGPETRRRAGAHIYVRELDTLAVYGRVGGMPVYELLGMSGIDDDPAHWTGLYEQGLIAYRAQDFDVAVEHFKSALSARGFDQPSKIMIDRCEKYLKYPPPADWDGLAIADTK